MQKNGKLSWGFDCFFSFFLDECRLLVQYSGASHASLISKNDCHLLIYYLLKSSCQRVASLWSFTNNPSILADMTWLFKLLACAAIVTQAQAAT